MIAAKIPQILFGAKALLRSLRLTHGYSSLAFVFIACLGGAATSASATTYYVSTSGSDGNGGTSTSTPWQTIAKVNSALFQPGDSVLFQGSGTFSGALVFSYATNVPTSSATNVITVGSYGTGPATILSTGSGSGSSAVTLNGVNGIAVTGLTILGGGGTSPITWCGVKISNGSGYGISNVTVNNCDISNFAGSSFAQTAEVYLSGGSNLDTINITNNALHGANGPGSLDSNGIYGIGNGQNITNVTYSGNTVYNLGGVASNQGGGIVANGVNGGVLEYNIVHDVGGNTTSCGGVAGVWAYYSSNITIQYNEVYNIRPITYTAGCDWNAYDLDGGVSNSVVQYNYSHNNAGGAMLAFVANVGGETWGDNTFRYNISENDGLGAGNWVSAAITITGSPQNALEMYGNTIYSGMRSSTNNSSMIQSNQGHSITLSPDSFITNNIFYMTPQAGVQMMYCPYGISGGTIDYNIYYTTGTSSVWRTTTNYTKFSDYQVNTGYDLHSFQLNPQLAGPGTGGTLSWTPSLHNGPQPAPGAYQLSSSSPAIDAGVILSGSSVDYYGSPVPNGGGENIGADSAGSTTLPLITSARAQVDFTGLAFNYQVTALNSPVSFGATGLPSGLSFNSTTGVISGATTLSGTFNVTLSAVNASGTSTATLVLISRPPPVITSATAVTATNNIRFKYQITASNYPTNYNATNLPAGLSFDSSKGLISGIPTATGTTSVTIGATNAAGTGSANLTITVAPLPPPVTYYVSNSGSDSNNGTSTSTPWQTITKVNSALFHSGDSVLFQGSGTFSGALVFSYATNVPESTPLYPITVGSYGTGSATILSTSSGSGSSAITLNGVNGISVTGLTILGAGGTSPITWIGVNITNGSGYGISKVTVNNCDISNFAGTAAANSAEVRLNGGSGLDTIKITNNVLHGANGPGSLDSNGIYGVGNGNQNTTNVTYSGNTVYNLGGVGANTGGGIVANDVNGGVLEYNIVHDIGANTTSCGGVAGVWAYASNNITIQYNEVYNVRPITYTAGCDWNAYDLDGGVSNSVVQYNYSHNNAGCALLAFVGSVNGNAWGYNTFRYNVSENDGLGSGNYASSAITITGSPQNPLEMYGNTIYCGMRSSTNGSSMIQSNQGYAITLSPDSFITNNIFYMTPQAGTQMMYCPYGISGGTIDYNIYYTTGASSVWRTTANYTKFADYQVNTGYDLHSFQLDPQLAGPGTGGTLSWTPSLHNGPQPAPSAYRLSSSSPAIDAGVILSGSSVGYYGDPVPNAGGENIGADTAGTTTLPLITSIRAATGTVNTAFNYTITALNSPTSYNAVNLPAGLSVNTSTGVISGAPTVAGTTNVTISAVNATGTGTATLTLIVPLQPPVITSALSATGTAGSAFSYTITASNSPTSYGASGLPAGLSVNTSTGAITGTPSAPGTSSVTVSAINATGTGTATLTLTVQPTPPPPVITSALSATGTAGSVFSYTITASNSPTSYGASGLPAGLSVNTSTGAITGTPSASGTSSVTLSATNGGGVGTATLTLTVSAGPIAAISVSPATAAVASGSTQQFSAVAKDSLGNALDPQPAIAWTASGGGTIAGNGLFTAGSSAGGPYTVTATSGSISGTATVSVLPAAPSNLAATWATMLNGWYKLTWTDNSTNESGFAIQSLSGTTWTTLASVAANVTSYTRTGLNMPSGPYTLRVIATGSSGNSAASNQVSFSIPTPPSMPNTLVATAGASGVNLTWGAVSGATSYTIMRSATSGTSGFSTLKANQSGTSYLDTTAVSGTTYWYKACYNVSGVGTSLYGSPVSVIAGVPMLTTITVSPSSASVQTGSNQQFSAVGKDQNGANMSPQPTFAWSVGGGGTIDSTGLLSATTAGGPFTVTATSGTVNGGATITVVPPAPAITSALSANGTTGSAFSYQIVASNSPTSYGASGLPAGLSVNTNTGLISGTPASAGTSNVTISASNAGGTGSATLTITVVPPAPVITSALSANGTTGSAFSYQIAASNNPTSYGASGLPAGLSVNTGTGLISGTPAAAGTSNVTISASNAGGTGSATLTITVVPPAPAITSALSASVTAGSAFSYQITASNSPTSYNATGLPAGLSVNTGTGAITGTPTASGTSSVTLSATNAGGTGTATLTLTVSAGPIATISVSPATATVFSGATQQFSAVSKDSFGNVLNPQPAIAWTVSAGGTIDGNGLFTAGSSTGGPYTVTATSGSTSGTATVSVAENVANGTWTNTTGGLWNTIANWSGGSGPVAAGSGFTADFSTLDITAATTVNLDSSHNIGTLVFGDTATGTAGSWVLANNGSAGNVLTLGGAATVTVNAMANGTVTTAPNVTIGAVIDGSGGLVKDGSATNTVNGGAVKSTSALVLTGANAYTGTTDIKTGMIVAKNATALGGSTVTVESGATLVLGTGSAIANTITLNGTGALAVAGLGSTATLSGTVNLQSDSGVFVTNVGGNNKLTISSAGSVALGSHVLAINTQGSVNTATIDGTVTGDAASGITVSGGAPLTISGNNPGYHGATTVGKAELRIGSDTAIGDGGLVLAPGNDSSAFVDSASVGAARTLVNAVGFGASNTGSRFLFASRNAANLTFTNTTNIVLGSLVRKIEVWNGTQVRFDAGFSGTGGITLNLQGGNGTLVLNGASTYTGATTVNAGTLVVNGSLGATAVSVNATGTLAGTGGFGGGVTVNSNGHLACAIASAPGSQVPLAITGALTLGSGNILDLTATATPAAGVYTLATAAGGVTYTAGTVNLTGASGVVSVSGNSLILTITAP